MISLEELITENVRWIFSGVGVAILAGAVSWLRRRYVPTSAVRLTAPHFGRRVGRIELVEGVVSPSTANVVVVVHPMATDGYWPQRQVTVRDDGTWAVEVFVGAEGEGERGARFEIAAFADPTTDTANVLRDWPRARAKSDVIQVFRA